MQQVVQSVNSGLTQIRDLPDPVAPPAGLVVGIRASLISAGTERYVVELARKSLIGKALDRPDHVRRVLQKIKQEGLLATLGQVRAKLDEPMPLGYSAAGVVLECGRGVQEFKPGDRVATTGPHAEIVAVGRTQCARIPDGVSFEQAAYTSVAAIALEGVRLSQTTLGERVVVIGLGLVGLLSVALLKAQGCRVYGIDLDPAKVGRARELGLDEGSTIFDLGSLKRFTGPAGVDAALITASTTSNEPVEFAAEACRVRGRVVLVGVAGLNLPRAPFFKKELQFTVSSSLGPGRGDPQYEEKGVDYPAGFVRWTAQRNMEAVLDLMSSGTLPVERLTTHRFPIGRGAEAYELITKGEGGVVGILLDYGDTPVTRTRKVQLPRRGRPSTGLGLSVIGSGNFARLVMLPALTKIPGLKLRGLCSAKGMTAQHSGTGAGFAFAATDARELFADPETRAVIIATRHDQHAEIVKAALEAGKHVLVEKPLCIKLEEYRSLLEVVARLGKDCPLLAAGFNRRFAAGTARLKEFFSGIHPLSVGYRFAPGAVPGDHWTQDEDVGGGRLIGEASHAIDLALDLAGSPAVRVFAESSAKDADLEVADDRVMITLRHANGSVSSVSYQAGGDRAAPAERIEMFGGGRTAVLEGWSSLELWSSNRCRKTSLDRDRGHRNQWQAFVEACSGQMDWPVSWPDLENSTLTSLLAVESLRAGVPLEIPGGTL